MEHLTFDKIHSYLEGQIPENEGGRVEEHLAVCQRCHKAYLGLRTMGNIMGRAVKSLKGQKVAGPCPEEWEIGALIRGEAHFELSDKLSDHIRDCADCLGKAAGYYTCLTKEEKKMETPYLWKEQAVQALRGESVVRKKATSFFQHFLAFWQKLTLPLPALPGYALAAAAIALLIWTNIPQESRIYPILSSEKIIVKDAEIPSTLGFMGDREERAVEAMKLVLEGKRVNFRWEPPEDTAEYAFSLLEKPEGKLVFSQTRLRQPQVFLKKSLLDDQRLYTWIIEGKTVDGRYFEHSGDFVLVR